MITVDYIGDYEPTRGSEFAAGSDLRACLDQEKVLIRPGEYAVIKSGICAQPPVGYAGFLMGRSGISKRGLRLSTGTSLIDPDYIGDITCCMYNDSNEIQYIYNGERIAQIVYVPFVIPTWNKVDKLAQTKRSKGGFGSTGS